MHWHITDSHSFPIKLERYPKTTGRMADIGAYNENSKYTLADVREIVEHANINGTVSDEELRSLGPYLPNNFYILPAKNDSLHNRDFKFRYSSNSGV